MQSCPKTLVIFDLDYTLTKKGTWGRFVWQIIKGRPWRWVPFLWVTVRDQLRYRRGEIPRIQVKETMIRMCMAGKCKKVMLEHARRFAEREVKYGLRPGGIRALEQHKSNGAVIIIISAAADIIVAEIAKRLNVKYFLATEMGWDAQGKLKERFASPNCYGPEKKIRFEKFLLKHPDISENFEKSIMYSDSHSDIPLMSECDVGVAVHPSKKLREVAHQYNFTIADWNS